MLVTKYSVLLAILQTPFFREVALWLRAVDVQMDSCKYFMTQMGPGNSIAITPGGAKKMLDSCHKDYILTVNRRKQFVKMALETGYVHSLLLFSERGIKLRGCSHDTRMSFIPE